MMSDFLPRDSPEEPADPVSCKIVHRVAALTEQEVTQLPPLYDTIDPDALDRLVHSAETTTTSLSIQFTYAGQQVTVATDGTGSCNRGIVRIR